MAIWKTLRTVYLVFVLLLIGATFFYGYPIYRYLKNPVTAPVESAAALPSTPAQSPSQDAPKRSISPQSLLGVSAEMIPKFEEIVSRVAPDSAEARVGLGILYQYKNRLAEAKRCYEQAIEMSPNQPDAHYRLGTVHHVENRLYDAAAEYQAAMRVKPDYAHAYYSLAALRQSEGKFDEAESLYRQILKINPKEYQAHNNLGIVYEQNGRFAEALKEYEKASALNPNDPVVKENLQMARTDAGTHLVANPGAAPAQAPREPPVVSAPADPPVSKKAFKPNYPSKIYLKNKRTMSGEIIERDARGLWFQADYGTNVYVSSDEIERVEEGTG